MNCNTTHYRANSSSVPGDPTGALGSYALRGDESDTLSQPRNEALQAMKADDLFAAARELWSLPRNVLYVGPRSSGDIARLVDPAPVAGAADAMKPLPPRKPVLFVVPAKPRVLLVDRKAAQVQVGLYIPDGTYDRAMVPTHRVYTEYMGGSMGSVVFQEIRESRSLAYDAGAGYRDASWKEDANVFNGALGTQADKTLDAIGVLMHIVTQMPASADRMENVKKSLDETYRTARTGFRRVPSTVLAWSHLGIDSDPRPWNWERVQKMTLEDVAAFASRWKTMPYTITIVGDKSKFDMTKLAQFGEVVEMKPDQLFGW